MVNADASVEENSVILDADESHHLLIVRRARPQDAIELLDGKGRRWRGTLAGTQKKRAIIETSSAENCPQPHPRPVHLWQALPKGKTMDAVVQKATELGVHSIRPLMTTHSEVELDPQRGLGKIAKWQTIAKEAVKQSGNPWMPIIEPVQTLKDALNCIHPYKDQLLIAALLAETKPLAEIIHPADQPPEHAIHLLVGPEGDLSPAEYQAALTAGFKAFTLGPLVLKVETAVICALSLIFYELSNSRCRK